LAKFRQISAVTARLADDGRLRKNSDEFVGAAKRPLAEAARLG